MTGAPLAPRAPHPLLRFLLLTLPVAALLPASARGDDPAVVVTAANQLEFYYDSEIEESLLDDRLDFSLARGGYSVGGTFLSHSPSDPARLDYNDFGAQTQGLRKRWIEAAADDWTVRAGDVYATFGRGVALAIFEDQTVDFDNVLDGAFARGAVGPAELRLIAGSNSIGETFQVLKAGRLELQDDAVGRVGFQGVWSDSTVSNSFGRPGGDRLYGASWERSFGSTLDLSGEYVVRRRKGTSPGAGDLADGHGGVASIALYLGRVQILGDYKDFLRYQLPYVTPPTTVRQHTTTLMNRGSHTPNIRLDDEKGGLAEAWISVRDGTRLVTSYSETAARKSHQPSREFYAELEQELGERCDLQVKGGETEETIIEGTDPIFFERLNGVLKGTVRWGEIWSLEPVFEVQRVQERNRAREAFEFPREYTNSILGCTLSRAPSLSLGLTTEWTDDATETDDLWVWAECNLRLGDRHQLLLGGGSLRGGQLCSGGVCKLVDPFEGGRVEFLTTF